MPLHRLQKVAREGGLADESRCPPQDGFAFGWDGRGEDDRDGAGVKGESGRGGQAGAVTGGADAAGGGAAAGAGSGSPRGNDSLPQR